MTSSSLYAASDVSKLLQKCDSHLKANHLTNGKGGTALECYKKVLEKDPENNKAINGLATIEDRYTKWAKQALEHGQKDKAKKYLASLNQVNPDSASLAKLEAQLQPSSDNAATPSPDVSESKAEVKADSSSDKAASKSEKEANSESKEKVNLPPNEIAKPTILLKKAKIIDISQIYESINATDCLIWTSSEIKEISGKNAWNSFYPKKDDVGVVVNEIKHCNFKNVVVYLLKIEQYYVPISSVGVQIISEKSMKESS
ncbi:tetratricopeptide repeat protein [Candidatus Halobeggiatoa sp. HSG11]|nr:tetratricopeptide repeat protein [Candidatus Halobeggiatoa sp. HSG11]